MCVPASCLDQTVRKWIAFRRTIVPAFAFAAAWGLMAASAMAQEEPVATAGSQNMLVKTWVALTPVFAIIFLLMSIVLVALVVRAILVSQKSNFAPEDLAQGVDASLEEGNAQAAVDLVQADDSFLSTVLSAGLAKLPKGREAAFEAMQVTGEAEIMKVEHMLGYLALIGNVAPMVGLLGTVRGMVVSFGKIASSAQTPKPNELASGIEQALYTTLVGLILAIPAIAIYNILRNKVQRHVLAAGVQAEDMLEKFEPYVGK
jgi:biopolymer transport protein ExbB